MGWEQLKIHRIPRPQDFCSLTSLSQNNIPFETSNVHSLYFKASFAFWGIFSGKGGFVELDGRCRQVGAFFSSKLVIVFH